MHRPPRFPRASVVVTLAGVAVALLVTSPAMAFEARCDELGDACICSEPMQDAEIGTPIHAGHNFADSPPETECDRYGRFFGITSDPKPSGVSIVEQRGMSWMFLIFCESL